MTVTIVPRFAFALAMFAARIAAQEPTRTPDSNALAANTPPDTRQDTWVRTTNSAAAILRESVSLDLRVSSLKDALLAVGEAAGVAIQLGPDVLASRAHVSLHVANVSVANALAIVLEGTGLPAYVSIRGDAVLVGRPPRIDEHTSTHRQDSRVTGRVLDAGSKQPVAAASVVVTGTTTGQNTTDSGTFSFRLPTGAKSLTVRRIGYLAQIVPIVAGQMDYTVALRQDVLRLEAQVVTGVATTVSSQNAANDVAVVPAQNITAVPAPTIENSLQGQVPGAVIETNNSGAPGGGLYVQIRGITSINAAATPLYVVDGVIVNNQTAYSGESAITAGGVLQPNEVDNGTNRIADLNPDDIESVEVLKGASASAIYGSKASLGVIIITTKHGTAGKPSWLISQTVGHFTDAQTLALRQFPTLASAQDWGAPLGYGESKIASVYSGPQDYQSQLFSNPQAAYETDISLSGALAQTQYFVSGLAKYDNGIQTNTGYQKSTVRANVTQQLFSTLSVSANLTYAHSLTRRGISGNDNIGIAPYNAFAYTPQFVTLDQQHADGLWPVNPFGPANPFADAAEVQTPETVNRFIGGGNINWTAWSTEHQSLRVNVLGGADYTDQHDDLYAPPALQVEQATSLPGVATTAEANTSYSNLSLNVIHHYTGLSQLDFTTLVGFGDEH